MKNNCIFLLGPSGSGKTSLSMSFNYYLSSRTVNVDDFFFENGLSPIPETNLEIVKDWLKETSPKISSYVLDRINVLNDENSLNIIDMGGVASFPQTEEDINVYKELVKKYENFFIILPNIMLCKSAQILLERRNRSTIPQESFTGLINLYNLSHMQNLYKIFPEYDGSYSSIKDRILYQNEYSDFFIKTPRSKLIEKEIISRCNFPIEVKQNYLDSFTNKIASQEQS